MKIGIYLIKGRAKKAIHRYRLAFGCTFSLPPSPCLSLPLGPTLSFTHFRLLPFCSLSFPVSAGTAQRARDQEKSWTGKIIIRKYSQYAFQLVIFAAMIFLVQSWCWCFAVVHRVSMSIPAHTSQQVADIQKIYCTSYFIITTTPYRSECQTPKTEPNSAEQKKECASFRTPTTYRFSVRVFFPSVCTVFESTHLHRAGKKKTSKFKLNNICVCACTHHFSHRAVTRHNFCCCYRTSSQFKLDKRRQNAGKTSSYLPTTLPLPSRTKFPHIIMCEYRRARKSRPWPNSRGF